MRVLFPCLAVLLLVSAPAEATSVVPHTLAERAQQADRICRGKVLESRTVAPEGNPRRMTTVTRVLVTEDLKGSGPIELELVQPGGKLGLWEAHAAGEARFEAGETALLLVRCRDVQAPERCTLVAMGEGKLTLEGNQVRIYSIASGQLQRRPLTDVLAELHAAGAAPPVRIPPKVKR